MFYFWKVLDLIGLTSCFLEINRFFDLLGTSKSEITSPARNLAAGAECCCHGVGFGPGWGWLRYPAWGDCATGLCSHDRGPGIPCGLEYSGGRAAERGGADPGGRPAGRDHRDGLPPAPRDEGPITGTLRGGGHAERRGAGALQCAGPSLGPGEDRGAAADRGPVPGWADRLDGHDG